MTAARRRIFAAVKVLLAFALLYALAPAAASAQESETLPQIRFVHSGGSQSFAGIQNFYLCHAEGRLERNKCLELEQLMLENPGTIPDVESRGGRRLSLNDTVSLGERRSFMLFLNSGEQWYVYEVHVQRLHETIEAPVSGTIHSSGPLAPVNGLRILQGEPLFSIVPDLPAVVDFDLSFLRRGFRVPRVPAPTGMYFGVSEECC